MTSPECDSPPEAVPSGLVRAAPTRMKVKSVRGGLVGLVLAAMFARTLYGAAKRSVSVVLGMKVRVADATSALMVTPVDPGSRLCSSAGLVAALRRSPAQPAAHGVRIYSSTGGHVCVA